MPPGSNTARLYQQLQNTGLAVSNQPLYQLIHALIDAALITEKATTGSSSGGGGSVINNNFNVISGMLGLDGKDGEESLIPGPAGIQGIQGVPGTNGSGGGTPVVFFPENDYEPSFIVPGPIGITGAAGPTGSAGLSIAIPGIDGNDGDDGYPIPGPAGANGTNGIANAEVPIVTTTNQLIDANFGMVIPESLEIGPGLNFEIAGGARLEITGAVSTAVANSNVGLLSNSQPNIINPNILAFCTVLGNQSILNLATVPVNVTFTPPTGVLFVVLYAAFQMEQSGSYATSANVRLRYPGITADLVTATLVPTNAPQHEIVYIPAIGATSNPLSKAVGQPIQLSLSNALGGPTAAGKLSVYLIVAQLTVQPYP